jgi:flagellar biosynthetic protein FliR
MEISLDQISALVGDYFWPFLRVGALFIAAPIFGARTIPVRVRVILALVVTLVIQPTLPFLESISVFSPEGIFTILQQLSIGLVMGMALQIVFATLVMAGQLIATTMGLGFASSVDPQNGVQVTMMGQFYLIIATLFFLAMDGHLRLLEILVGSFDAIPIGAELISVGIFWDLALFASEMFVAAVLIALPIMIGVLLVNIGFGVMTRAAPQLNIFAVGFPTTMLAGFVLAFLGIPVIYPQLSNLFINGLDFIAALFT